MKGLVTLYKICPSAVAYVLFAGFELERSRSILWKDTESSTVVAHHNPGLCLKLMDVFKDDGSQDGVQRDFAGPRLFLVLGLLNETADSRLHNLRI